VAFALVVGFGLGGALFLLPRTDEPAGGWFVAAGRVHGHIQLIGWAGLMVLGVALYFLPRLRGRGLAHPEHARTTLVLLVAGLLLRVLTEPALAADPTGRWSFAVRPGLIASGLLELAGVSLALALLVLTLRGDPPAMQRDGLRQMLFVLAVAFASFWLASLTNLLYVWSEATGNPAATTTTFDRVAVLLAMYGFLVTISVGMGVRVFPLHFGAQHPDLRLVRFGLAMLVAGLVARVCGVAAGRQELAAAGILILAVALVLLVVGLRIFAPRRRIPGQRKAWYADPAQLCGLTAFVWLVMDAGLLAVLAAATLIGASTGALMDAERHLVGAGFITLLIFGEGANLLPGFARCPLRTEWLVWITLGLGNCAVLLRVGPLILAGALQGSAPEWVLGAAGVVDLLAVGAFAANVPVTVRQRPG
jgi:uncharacterized protein involved in response to NO